MSFLSPVFLLALPLIAVPVLIHFFARRQRNVIRWGAMDFLLASNTPRRRFLRLRDLLLMLLRAAIVLAIVGALAQPMLSSHWLGTTGPRDVVIILDNSMSTARRVGGATVFDRELEEAAKLVAQLKPTDVLRVMLAAPTPEWLSDKPVSGDSSDLNGLIDRMREVKPNEASADMLDCVQEAIKARRSGKDMPRLIAVVTDGQAHGWRADASGAWSAVHDVAKKSSPPVYIRVVRAAADNGSIANLAVEKISAARAVVAVGQPVILTASLKNTGTVPSAPTVLAWSAGKESLGISEIPALQPGVETTASLSQLFAAPGLQDISCAIAAQDDLPEDNSAQFLLEVAEAAPVLIVEGEPQMDAVQSDSQYFLAALGYDASARNAGSAASVFKPTLIDYQHLRSTDLSGFQCVVLANVPRLSADIIQRLARYVNSGGGLWIALGEQTDILAFNQGFFEQSAGLSPLPLLQPIGDATDREKSMTLSPPAADHPATALLADTQRLDIDRARIYRRHQFDSYVGNSIAVLLRIQGGAPLAVERSLGRGRVIVQAVPLGLAWSNLPLCEAYLVMVREWLWYLTEPGLVKRNLQAGEPVHVTQPINSSKGRASLETPSGRVVQLAGLEEEGRLVFRYLKTLIPGEYRLTMTGAQKTQTETFLVGRDPEESDLTPLSEQQIKTLADAGGLEFEGDPLFQPAAQKVIGPPRALATWLLSALVLLMLAEIMAAFWMTHRRRAVAQAVVMKPGVRA